MKSKNNKVSIYNTYHSSVISVRGIMGVHTAFWYVRVNLILGSLIFCIFLLFESEKLKKEAFVLFDIEYKPGACFKGDEEVSA